MKTKTVINFIHTGDIEDQLMEWASQNNFMPCDFINTHGLVDTNNVSYCFYKTKDECTTFITLHQLDGIVRLEAWITQPVATQKQLMNNIDQLLTMLELSG